MSHTRTYFDLLDAFGQEGCPVCRLASTGIRRYLESINYEGVNDLGFRNQTRAARGFCNVHAYQWLTIAHVLATALIYEQVLVDINEILSQLRFRNSSILARLLSWWRTRGKRGDDHPLAPRGRCPACMMLEEQERTLVVGLVDALREATFREAYTDSAGLCLPHLRRALDAAPDATVFTTLRDIAVEDQERLHGQLREIIRKHDYRYRNEASGPEVGAAARAVAHVAAAPGISH